MSEQTPRPGSGTAQDMQAWIASWPPLRQTVEQRLEQHARRDPSLHFELTLAQLEIKEIDESMRRMSALMKILDNDDLTQAELHGTGNY